ncbi:MAG: phosphate/phosphite/phosphonate ABC transporter substrate-binding protein, partial [Bdellovibrio sp.]
MKTFFSAGQFFGALTLVAAALLPASCTSRKAELGTAENPVKFFFTPSVDAKVLEDNSKVIQDFLEKNTPYKFQVSIPQSYIAVVEAFGTKRADICGINTFGYILAHEKYGVEVKLTVVRRGLSTYQSQFLARADGTIRTLADFKGKKVALVDAASASGYLVPLKTLKDKGYDPGQIVFAGKHDNVVSMIYQGQVDGGATFYSPPSENRIRDARELVLTQYPDVEKKVKIVALSDPIPNDPIIFRREMPDEMKEKIAGAIIKLVGTPEGREAFEKIFGATDVKRATDA